MSLRGSFAGIWSVRQVINDDTYTRVGMSSYRFCIETKYSGFEQEVDSRHADINGICLNVRRGKTSVGGRFHAFRDVHFLPLLVKVVCPII
jgi:hypothetical protein